jgi:putative tryptophan/tyrosine transport system substrate-binding protein
MSQRHPSATLFAIACLLVLPLATAQSPSESLRLGVIEFSSLDLRRGPQQGLLEALRLQGYVEGENLVLERRYADGRPERVGEIAKELAAMRLDAIVTTCTPTSLTMSRATETTPIVMARVADPVSSNLVSSLAHPGKNVTGLSSQFENVAPKMLELLLETVPNVGLIGVVFNPGNAIHKILMGEVERAARARGVSVRPVDMGLKVQVADAFEAMKRQGVASLLVLPDDPVLLHRRRLIAELALRDRLPSFFGVREAVEDGGLISYGANMSEIYRQVAYYVDRIAGGAKPANLPVQQPNTFELVINLKTSKALGITIPQSILLRADRVLE